MAAPPADSPPDQRSLARALRLEGLTRSEIARDLGVTTWRVTELLAGEAPRAPGLRNRAKDDLRAKARELRADGRTMPEIAAELRVSKSSVSLWTADLPKPPRRSYSYPRVAAARRAQWSAFLAQREEERQANKAAAAATVGGLADRELLLIGATLYWAEGAKDKVYDRREKLRLINSDPDVIRLYLRWLALLGFHEQDMSYSVSIHESADLAAAERFWRSVVGPGGRWRKPAIKKHNRRTRRKNVGAEYHGCLLVEARQSRVAYQRMEGLWSGIVGDLSGVV